MLSEGEMSESKKAISTRMHIQGWRLERIMKVFAIHVNKVSYCKKFSITLFYLTFTTTSSSRLEREYWHSQISKLKLKEV